ncbi:unnamed protein product [Prorocentrum cordatum]|uniref:Uncharacterized protein n=1 Tax=Prorocentrum cordatum TaxID=2364126 RepID=A0ABN9TF56_9DINO|nr:unnamed protein product [Polarella glacialis]
MGCWSYQRNSADLGDIRKLCLAPSGCPEPYFVGFSSAHGRHCVGLAAEDMRRVRHVLHHARGPFTAVAGMLIEESGCPKLEAAGPANLRARVIVPLWVPSMPSTFLAAAEVGDVDWTPWCHQDRNLTDQWLFSLRGMIRKRFVHKWLLLRVQNCATCSNLFGLDGKRGMKWFVCACLDGGRARVPELGLWVSEPCPFSPLQGSLYHAKRGGNDEDDEAEPDVWIAQHRRTDGAHLQRRVETSDADGLTRKAWFDSPLVGRPLARAREQGMLPEKKAQGERGEVRRRARASDVGQADAANVFTEADSDGGPCGIDKAAQDAGPSEHVQKWSRRRLDF